MDFIFGDVKGKLTLDAFNSLSKLYDRKYFVAQLNRYLKSNDGVLTVHDNCSSPSFYPLIRLFDLPEIGRVNLVPRQYDKEYVGKVMGLELYLDEGILSLELSFAAYKEVRAHELFSGLLTPLAHCGFDHLITLNGEAVPSHQVVDAILEALDRDKTFSNDEKLYWKKNFFIAKDCFKQTNSYEECSKVYNATLRANEQSMCE